MSRKYRWDKMINQEKLERLTALKNEMDSYRSLDRKQLEALEQETWLFN